MVVGVRGVCRWKRKDRRKNQSGRSVDVVLGQCAIGLPGVLVIHFIRSRCEAVELSCLANAVTSPVNGSTFHTELRAKQLEQSTKSVSLSTSFVSIMFIEIYSIVGTRLRI